MTDETPVPPTPEMLDAAASFATGFQPFASGAPSRHVAVVACMDARLDPFALFGLKAGEAHVMRNAGGVVTDDMIRSLAISQRKLGTRSIVLVHHTQCGMQTFTDDELNAELLQDTGQKPSWAPETIQDLEADLAQSMRRIKTSPFIPHTDDVRGFVFQVEDGGLREVVLED
jgi:carbonic anhydrase